MLIGGLRELIEDARWTMILGGTHVLTNRLGVEHAITTLRQEHETEHLLTVARAHSRVDDLPKASGANYPRCKLRAEVELDRGPCGERSL